MKILYISSDVAQRIKNLAKNQNLSMKDILINAGLGSNTMSNMKTSMPKADSLAKIADQLNCSVDYLLGRTDKKETPAEAEVKLQLLINFYNQLNAQNQALLNSVLQSMLEQQEKDM